MRTRYLCLGSVACWCSLVLGSSPAPAAEPTAQDLVALAPVIRSDDATIRTIEIAGYSRHEGRLRSTFHAFYKAPDRFAFVMSDGQDNIPFSFCADRKLLVYDPVRPELLIFHKASGYSILDIEDGKYHEVHGTKFASDTPETLLLDLKAMFAPPQGAERPTDVRVVKIGDNQYTLIERYENAYRRSRVDLARPNPFTTFELARSPAAEPHFCIDKIVINGDVDDARLRFPLLNRTEGLTVKEIQDGTLSGPAVTARAFYARANLHEPLMSRGLLAPAMMGVHWGRVRDNDEKYAPVVRGLIPMTPIPREFYVSDKIDDPEAIRRTGLDKIRGHIPGSPIKVRIKLK